MSRMRYDQEMFEIIADALKAWGFSVWKSKSGTYGFYTDEQETRLVSFQTTDGVVTFSGNYVASQGCGTGWQMESDAPRTKQDAEKYLYRGAPYWANPNPTYTTVAQHLEMYGVSSGYNKE